ncbi:MAG: LysE family translocator [Paracoccaceae bacterium]|nr:LysE family translocator [Paracoccaceae bacterium]
MDTDLLFALYVFVVVAIFTPGPNNMMLLASGANFGVRRTVPHMLGIMIGHAAMVVVLGLGLAGVLAAAPLVFAILKYACLAYLLWLAWRIAHAAPPEGAEATGRPMSFFEAALFQWVNPKAWAVALTAVTAYAPGEGLFAVAVTALVFLSVSLPSVSLWAGLGTGIRRWLDNPGRLRAFNWTMAFLLVGSTLPVLF